MRKEPLMEFQYQEDKAGMMMPGLQISENSNLDKLPVGKFGKIWKDYMMENHPHRISELIAEGRINEVILQVDREAEEKKEDVIQQLLKKQPLPEDTMERIQSMNQITMMAEEMILAEFVMTKR